MPQVITNKRLDNTIGNLIKEMRELKDKIDKFTSLVPEESIKEYKNWQEIKKDFFSAFKSHPQG